MVRPRGGDTSLICPPLTDLIIAVVGDASLGVDGVVSPVFDCVFSLGHRDGTMTTITFTSMMAIMAMMTITPMTIGLHERWPHQLLSQRVARRWKPSRGMDR